MSIVDDAVVFVSFVVAVPLLELDRHLPIHPILSCIVAWPLSILLLKIWKLLPEARHLLDHCIPYFENVVVASTRPWEHEIYGSIDDKKIPSDR